mgnify:CR=1 FL=1
MADIIKNNVVDCIEDVKRQCVEIQCNGNVAGEEVVAYLKSVLPDGVIKNIEYTFGTRDFEVETYTAAQTKELNAAINKITLYDCNSFAEYAKNNYRGEMR